VLSGEQLEQVNEIVSSITEYERCGVGVKKRTGLALAVIGKLSKMWKSKERQRCMTVHAYKALVVTSLAYCSAPLYLYSIDHELCGALTLTLMFGTEKGR